MLNRELAEDIVEYIVEKLHNSDFDAAWRYEVDYMQAVLEVENMIDDFIAHHV